MSAAVELWPFQGRGVDRVIDWIDNTDQRSLLVCSPTGSGKTVMASEVARRLVERHFAVTFMAPRYELLEQLTRKLDQWCPFGYGMITAGRTKIDLYKPIQVASVDTLVSRALKRKNIELPKADLLMVDEAHLYGTEHRTNLIKLYPNARVIGWTATPGRHDGRSLRSVFDKLIGVASVKQLITDDYLVRPVYYAPSAPDMEKVRTIRGDYDQTESALRMMPLLGDIVGHWMRLASGRRTAVFAMNVAQSVFLAESFRAHGVTAEHCDGTASPQHRKAIFDRFRSGETQVLCNVELATYGFDLPELDCIVMARPTKSIVKYMQIMGRGMRRSPGKRDCLVLDHAGNVHYHGFVDEERYWSLDGVTDKFAKQATTSKKKRKAPRNLVCPDCKSVFTGSLTCPHCGHYFEAAAEEFCVEDGQLVPIDKEGDEARRLTELERMRFFTELKTLAQGKGFKPGFAAWKYKERFKEWPPRQWETFPGTPVSLETTRYLKHMWIRQKKGREKAQRLQNLSRSAERLN